MVFIAKRLQFFAEQVVQQIVYCAGKCVRIYMPSAPALLNSLEEKGELNGKYLILCY
jgi:hypothetical protein